MPSGGAARASPGPTVLSRASASPVQETFLGRIAGFRRLAAGLRIAGEGVAVDAATGRLSIDTDRLGAGVVVTVTATNALGSDGQPAAPDAGHDGRRGADRRRRSGARRPSGGASGGRGVVGMPRRPRPRNLGGGAGARARRRLAPRRGGRRGATGTRYTPAAADEGKCPRGRVTARNAAGSTSAETAALAVVYAAPRWRRRSPTSLPTPARAGRGRGGGGLRRRGADVRRERGRGDDRRRDRVVSIATDRRLDGERITVTATNSGGSASVASFAATVRGAGRVVHAPPALGGTGTIGAAVSLDPGPGRQAGADDSPSQWLRDGDRHRRRDRGELHAGRGRRPDRAELPGHREQRRGQASAETDGACGRLRGAGGRAATLADLGLCPRRRGSGRRRRRGLQRLGPELRGERGGATIDAGDRRLSIPTAALLAATTVTVTATNSGGSASVSFGEVSVGAWRRRSSPRRRSPAPARSARRSASMPGAGAASPAPAIASQWRRDGSDIAGATGASYTPVAADDRTALDLPGDREQRRGQPSATTTALPVAYAAPVASGHAPRPDR